MRPVILIIRDGWGLNPRTEGNAVAAAKTPNITAYKAAYPWTTLECAASPSGFPTGTRAPPRSGT